MSEDLILKLTLTQLKSGKVYAQINQSPRESSQWAGYEFALPKGKGDWLETFLSQWQKPKAKPKPNLQQFGQRLYEQVFDPGTRARLAAVLNQARNEGLVIRLLLNLCGPSLVPIPFELLHDGKGFLLYSGVQIIRIFDELPQRSASRGPFRRLLAVLSQPKDEDDWGHDEYVPKLEDVLRKIGGLKWELLQQATRQSVLDELRESSAAGKPYDAVYFVAHGKVLPEEDAALVLRDLNGEPELLEAGVLAQALRGHPGCFVYLNSCSTAAVTGSNPFAGVAQRLMRDGGCGAVLAMQKPVAAERALPMAESFFHDLAIGKSFAAAAHWAVTTHGGNQGWAIPCLYSHIPLPDQELRDRLAAFFSADPATATFGFYLPVFRIGVPDDRYEILTSQGQIAAPKEYHYKGPTHAVADVSAAHSLFSLLNQMLPRERIPSAVEFSGAADALRSKATHLFLFGSKSQPRVAHLMKSYSKDFSLEYEDPVTKSDALWRIRDHVENKVYEVANPSKFKPGPEEHGADEATDYAIVEKIIDPQNGRVFFVVAGFQDRGTRGAGEYLAGNWGELVRKFGAAPFKILLKFSSGLDTLKVDVLVCRGGLS